MTNKQAQITINAIKFMLDNAQYSEDVEEALNMAINALTAQLNPTESSLTQKALDTISRQAAIRWVKTECNPYGKPTLDFESGKKVIKHLEQMPSVQPEIILCKDCKHRIEHKHYGDLGESAYTCEGNMVGWILPDGFCSNAERRTDG